MIYITIGLYPKVLKELKYIFVKVKLVRRLKEGNKEYKNKTTYFTLYLY